MVVKSVGVLSLAKVSAVLYALAGLFIGACVSLVAMAGALSDANEFGPLPGLFGVAAVVLFPIFYGVAGFVGSLIVGVLYNFVAGTIGGVEIDVS
jgi:hypothetical protein